MDSPPQDRVLQHEAASRARDNRKCMSVLLESPCKRANNPQTILNHVSLDGVIRERPIFDHLLATLRCRAVNCFDSGIHTGIVDNVFNDLFSVIPEYPPGDLCGSLDIRDIHPRAVLGAFADERRESFE